MTLQVAAPNSEDSSIVDYIFRVREALRECVISIHKCRAARETFVNTILAVPGLDILEYDAVSFKYIGLLLNDNNSNDKFHCYLHIALGESTTNVCCRNMKPILSHCRAKISRRTSHYNANVNL